MSADMSMVQAPSGPKPTVMRTASPKASMSVTPPSTGFSAASPRVGRSRTPGEESVSFAGLRSDR